MQVADLVSTLNRWFPLELAEDWDNVGLLIGDPETPVQSVMTCLTVTPDSAREAIQQGANVIVSHHPILFRPVKRLTADGRERYLYDLIRAGIAVYSPHTAFDSALSGINEQIAQRLELEEVRPLRPTPEETKFKVVVFVPESDLAEVQDAMFQAGAGVIGEYQECSFRLTGTGTFRGSEASNPTVGQKGRREEVAEHRLEVLVEGHCLDRVLAAMRLAHSYEEPAFDVYPLKTFTKNVGAGRMGRLSASTTLDELAKRAGRGLGCSFVQYVGNPQQACSLVSIGCGSAAEFLRDAKSAGCDAFITGEARFHDLLEAESRGVGLVLLGHYASERFAVETLAERIQKEWPVLNVWASKEEHDPIHRVTLT